jgi:polyhydroxybutyrate depolymerase
MYQLNQRMIFVFLLSSGCKEMPAEEKEVQQQTEEAEPAGPSPEGVQTFEHGGLERKYFLHWPDDLPQGAPLVFVMHGYTGSASGIKDYSGMDEVADANGFAVCYPKGTSDQWDNNFFNVGYEFHSEQTVDDLAFVQDLAAELGAVYGLSETNVFATGMSNGGDMSYYLACEASETIKAVAPIAGTMMEHIYNSCAPERPMPIFEVHGTEDDVTYWEGDLADVDGWGAYMDIPTIIDFWADVNGLDQFESTELPDTDTSDGSEVVFDRHWGDSTSNEVWLYRVEGGGHDWPGPWGNGDINTSEEVWRFFSQYVE